MINISNNCDFFSIQSRSSPLMGGPSPCGEFAQLISYSPVNQINNIKIYSSFRNPQDLNKRQITRYIISETDPGNSDSIILNPEQPCFFAYKMLTYTSVMYYYSCEDKITRETLWHKIEEVDQVIIRSISGLAKFICKKITPSESININSEQVSVGDLADSIYRIEKLILNLPLTL